MFIVWWYWKGELEVSDEMKYVFIKEARLGLSPFSHLTSPSHPDVIGWEVAEKGSNLAMAFGTKHLRYEKLALAP